MASRRGSTSLPTSPCRSPSISPGSARTSIRCRKRLRKLPAVELHESFPPYGAAFRRRFGIDGEQALELFHQTVSMKAVGDLTDFVRTHMLEPFPVEDRIRHMIAHFEDLTRAHEAVLKARAQIERLTPIVADCDAHAALAAEIDDLRGSRDALRRLLRRAESGIARQAYRRAVERHCQARRADRLR